MGRVIVPITIRVNKAMKEKETESSTNLVHSPSKTALPCRNSPARVPSANCVIGRFEIGLTLIVVRSQACQYDETVLRSARRASSDSKNRSASGGRTFPLLRPCSPSCQIGQGPEIRLRPNPMLSIDGGCAFASDLPHPSTENFVQTDSKRAADGRSFRLVEGKPQSSEDI